MSDEIVIAELREFVAREFLHGKDEGLEPTTPLIEWGIIDSIAIVSLADFVFSRFGVKIPNAELKPSNLATLQTIASMVNRLRG
jgi:acyl carrier protein